MSKRAAHGRASLSLQVVLLVAVTLFAAFFRLHDLDSIPPGLFGDEAANGLVAVSIQSGEKFPVYIEEPEETKWGSREPLYHYMMALVFGAFGIDATTIRLTSAIIGIMTVAILFLLCLRLFDWRVAALASILMAAGKWHVIASRIGLRAVLVPLWIVLILLLFESMRRRRSLAIAAALGAIVGLGFYTYPSFWMVPPCLLLVWGSWLATPDGGGSRRRPAASLVVASGIAALVVMSPLMRYAAEKPDYYFARVSRAAVASESGEAEFSLRDNVQKVLLMLHLRGDRNPRHDIPGEPMLDSLTGVLFLMGLFLVARRDGLERPQQVGLLSFWLLPLIPSALADSAPHALRALGAAPAVYLIAALGWEKIRRVKVVGPAVTLAIGVAVVGINYRDCFQRWASDPVVEAAFNTDAVRFFDYVAEAAGSQDVYTSRYVYTSPQLRFLQLRTTNHWELIADEEAFLAHAANSRDRLFVSDVPAVNALIEQLYGRSAEATVRYSLPGGSTGRVYRVRAENLRRSLDGAEIALIRTVLARTGH